MKKKTGKNVAERSGSSAGGTRGDESWLPRWGPFVIFGLLTAILFREFIISRGMLFGTDVIALGYFARHWYAEMIRQAHTFPLWNPYLYAGLPFVDAMHGDIFYPTTVLKFFMPVHRAMGWKIVIHVFLAGSVTYGWLRHLRVSRPIATFGGVSYMLAPVLISLIYPGHDGRLFVTALTPLALWVTDWSLTRGRLWRFTVVAFVVALLIYTPHQQLAYFATWAVAALAGFRLLQIKREGAATAVVGRRFAALALAGLIGAFAMGAAQLWTPLRYLAKYSQRVEKTTGAEAERGYAYSTSWSLHPEEAFSLVIPEFAGVNIQRGGERVDTYWGRNAFRLNHVYAGLLPLLLLPFAFLRRRRGEAWLFTGMAAGALIYALGATTPLFYLFYWLVPGVKLFRAPDSIMFVFAISVVTAAALGLQALVDREGEDGWEESSRRMTLYLWLATGVLLLFALLGTGGAFIDLWRAIFRPELDPAKAAALQANLPNIQQGLWLTALLTGLVAGGWHLRWRGAIPQAAWIGALILLSALDMLRVSPQFIQIVNPADYFPRDDVTEYLADRARRGEPFRVHAVGAPYSPNHFALFGVEQLAGHHGNEPGRSRDLIDSATDPARGLNPGVLQLLNTRYIVTGRPVQGIPEAYRGQRAIVYELPGALPRAFLVHAYETTPDSLALRRVQSQDFDASRTALLDPEHARALTLEFSGRPSGAGQPSSVRWIQHEVNRLALEVETPEPALLIISDNYYPAWRATVDGEDTPVLRADYTLRAVQVPAGRHEVLLEYHSPLLQASVWTTILSVLAGAGVVVGGATRQRRERAAKTTHDS